MTPTLADLAVAIGQSPALSIMLKATVVLLVALGAVHVGRPARAAVRHAFLASLFAVLVLLPAASRAVPPITIAIATRQAADSAGNVLSQSGARADAVASTNASHSPAVTGTRAIFVSRDTLVIAVWTIGAVLCLAPLSIGLVRLRRVRGQGRRWIAGEPLLRTLASAASIRRPIELRLHDAAIVPMTCGWTRPIVLLPANVADWTETEVEQALVHELEHVRRADWLVSLAARAVCALYWWHPLVWIAWRALNLEAERACDDAVLRAGEPTAYAEQLVLLARRISGSGGRRPALAMISRSDLAARVASVLDADRPRGRAGVARIAGIVAVGIALLAVLSPLQARSSPRSQTAAAATLPEFEVASVKSNKSGDFRTSIQVLPSRFAATNLPLRALVYYAWRLQMFEVDGGPGWTTTDRFDIAATFPEGTGADQVRVMLRSLLVSRFKLRTHTERRELAVYVMALARDDGRLGPKLRRSTADCAAAPPPTGPPDRNNPSCGFIGPAPGSDFPAGRAVMAFRGVSMDGLARFWTPALHRMVVNRTGLDGFFDGEFDPSAEFGPPPPPPGVPDPFDRASFPSAFTVLREQLGLKMDATRAPVDVLVIDGAEKPAPTTEVW